MTKLLHQVFGIWTTGTDFDPQHETSRNEKKSETSGPTDESETPKEPISKEVTEAPASLEPVIERVETQEALTNSVSACSQKQVSRPAIDYATLRNQVTLQQVLGQVTRVPIRGVQHRGPCPLHEPTSTTGHKFSANLKRQVFRCFDPNCGAQGNVLDFWQKHRGLDIYEAAEDLAKTFGIALPLLETAKQTSDKTKPKNRRGHHPPST